MPDFVAALPGARRAHTADPIDFAALRGKVVAVLGMGASSFDNAAGALEAGAEVGLFCRRAEPQVVQPVPLADVRRVPAASVGPGRRVALAIHEHGAGYAGGVSAADLGPLREMAELSAGYGRGLAGRRCGTGGRDRCEHGVVCGGFPDLRDRHRHGFRARPELAPPGISRPGRTGTRRRRSGRTSGWGVFLIWRRITAWSRPGPGRPWMGDIHLFTIASTMSFGPSGSSINAMTTAVPKLVAGVTRGCSGAMSNGTGTISAPMTSCRPSWRSHPPPECNQAASLAA